jgi:hypothetical protein
MVSYPMTITTARHSKFRSSTAHMLALSSPSSVWNNVPLSRGDGTAECGAGAEGWRTRPALALGFQVGGGQCQ